MPKRKQQCQTKVSQYKTKRTIDEDYSLAPTMVTTSAPEQAPSEPEPQQPKQPSLMEPKTKELEKAFDQGEIVHITPKKAVVLTGPTSERREKLRQAKLARAQKRLQFKGQASGMTKLKKAIEEGLQEVKDLNLVCNVPNLDKWTSDNVYVFLYGMENQIGLMLLPLHGFVSVQKDDAMDIMVTKIHGTAKILLGAQLKKMPISSKWSAGKSKSEPYIAVFTGPDLQEQLQNVFVDRDEKFDLVDQFAPRDDPRRPPMFRNRIFAGSVRTILPSNVRFTIVPYEKGPFQGPLTTLCSIIGDTFAKDAIKKFTTKLRFECQQLNGYDAFQQVNDQVYGAFLGEARDFLKCVTKPDVDDDDDREVQELALFEQEITGHGNEQAMRFA